MAGGLSGTAGSVVLVSGGTSLIGGMNEWSLDLSHSPVETTEFGEDWASYIPSIKNATGSFSGNQSATDTAQGALRDAFLGGSAVALRLYVNGAKYYDVGTALLTGMGPSIGVSGKGEISYDFQVSGPVAFV